ncbi:protein of unknown function DUF2470 [Penicillium expansum]|uniref:40S ribosomal protein S8 n=2 Tax=Penicillium TaxID=5073 RepID=A0A0A2JH69_PENEN|nr:protein of unknown function DUF2470 [Penicillium expansum]KGO38815.1 protein of unknown function DUF2470 [Penicillium expansum]KGO47075.1 protein of unknown function DUF2470 [Penicillium expansum]KGO54694.1 protein of unknown function DUF2470 [Penicillium expansum]
MSSKDFIIKHMNADHQESLILFLQAYCGITSTQAKNAHLEELSTSNLIITAHGTRYSVPIEPAMKNYSEARGRMVAMHKESLKRLGRSEITLTEYRAPRGIQAVIFVLCALFYVTCFQRSNLQPGSDLYEYLELQRVPWFPRLVCILQPYVVGIHIIETVALVVTQLKPLNVPVLSGLWWKWVASCFTPPSIANMGISRDSRHKRSATGAKRAHYRKKRAFEKGRQPANTRIGTKRIHLVRTRGGNQKFRGLRLESGNFSWGSEGISRKTRVIGVSFHPSNNELVRTNTLTKSAVVQIDAAPFRQWYEAHYGQPIGRRRQQKTEATEEKKSASVAKKQAARFADSGKTESAIERQFESGRLFAVVASRPGQSGRCDGYILEGEELAFYQKAIRK